jgi:hypothetical protein
MQIKVTKNEIFRKIFWVDLKMAAKNRHENTFRVAFFVSSGVTPLVFVITLGGVGQLERGVFCSPAGDVNKLEGVVLEQRLLVAQNFDGFMLKKMV